MGFDCGEVGVVELEEGVVELEEGVVDFEVVELEGVAGFVGGVVSCSGLYRGWPFGYVAAVDGNALPKTPKSGLVNTELLLGGGSPISLNKLSWAACSCNKKNKLILGLYILLCI